MDHWSWSAKACRICVISMQAFLAAPDSAAIMGSQSRCRLPISYMQACRGCRMTLMLGRALISQAGSIVTVLTLYSYCPVLVTQPGSSCFTCSHAQQHAPVLSTEGACLQMSLSKPCTAKEEVFCQDVLSWLPRAGAAASFNSLSTCQNARKP